MDPASEISPSASDDQEGPAVTSTCTRGAPSYLRCLICLFSLFTNDSSMAVGITALSSRVKSFCMRLRAPGQEHNTIIASITAQRAYQTYSTATSHLQGCTSRLLC